MHQMALRRHPAVLAAEAQVKEAAARNPVSGRLPNPEFESRLMFKDGSRTVFEGALMLSLPLSGRLGAANRVADIDLALAEAALSQARKQAENELGSILVRLEGARTKLALHEELAARSAEYAELARNRLSASLADPLDVSLVLADAASDKRALTRSRLEVVQIEEELLLLIGLNAPHLIIRTPVIEAVEICSDKESLVAMAQQHSELLLRARLEYQRAEWESALASRARIPDLRLGPAFNVGKEETEAGFAFSLPLPIFDTGASEYKASLAHRGVAFSALEFEVRSVNSRISMALNRLAALDAALEDLLGEVGASASEAFDLAEGRYFAGQTDVLRLLSAHRTHASVQLEIIELKVARHEVVLELESVIGCPLHDKRHQH
ncbi:MAG: TolC family protein [Gemmatimonadales bacterium]|nr:TolC family protein [Gemmatimonadales bacterium]